MDVETGLLRIAKVVSVLGWIWLAVFLLLAVVILAIGNRADDSFSISLVAAVVAVIGYAVAWAISWIIRGFAQRR